jgi:hypothetical protein
MSTVVKERLIRVQSISGRFARTLGEHNRAVIVEVSAEDAAGIEVALERARHECAAAAEFGFPVPEAIPYALT